MKLKHLICALAVVCALSTSISAQNETDKSREAAELRSFEVFTRLLGSQEAAGARFGQLSGFKNFAQWDFAAILDVSEKLTIDGVEIDDQLKLMMACGDMETALNGDSSDWAELVLQINDLKKDKEIYYKLVALSRARIPAFEILGEATGMSRAKIEKLALEGRIRPAVAARLMWEGFFRRYGGLDKQITVERRKRKQQ